uniref:Putative ovule protein n=1 Tax=Solanum chacoense TaxID=4108 RepID=A0A0V0HT28_SOLCH
MSIKLQGLLQWCFSTIILSPSSHKLLMRSTNRQNRLQHTQSPSIHLLQKSRHGLMDLWLIVYRTLEIFYLNPLGKSLIFL